MTKPLSSLPPRDRRSVREDVAPPWFRFERHSPTPRLFALRIGFRAGLLSSRAGSLSFGREKSRWVSDSFPFHHGLPFRTAKRIAPAPTGVFFPPPVPLTSGSIIPEGYLGDLLSRKSMVEDPFYVPVLNQCRVRRGVPPVVVAFSIFEAGR